MLKKHNKHGPAKWFTGVFAAAALLVVLPAARPVYAAGDTGSSSTAVPTSYVGFSAVSDVKVNNVSVKKYGQYNIDFDGNGADGNDGTAMADKTGVLLDAEVTLTNHYTRTGYIFTGWKDGKGVDYSDGQKVNAEKLGAKTDDTVKIIAQWKPITYKIRYDGNGATGTEYEEDFSYTGKVQTFTAPIDGTYQLEAWGAGTTGGFESKSRGGYSTGSIDLKAGDKLYVSVGGVGTHGNGTGESPFRGKGGWNGGGDSGLGSRLYMNTQAESGSGGGGATSIQKSLVGDGQLKNYESVKDSDVYLVAGGGGGITYDSNIDPTTNAWAYYDHSTVNNGYGGGLEGGSSKNVWQEVGGKASVGGTQTSGYAFGQGQNGVDSATQYADNTAGRASAEGNGGGGGGWYGGSTYRGTEDGSNAGGSGGSGHVGTMLSDGKTVAGNKTITEPDGSSSTGHKGSGYARISLVSPDAKHSGDAMSDSRARYDDSLNLTSNVFSRTGYVFQGWSENKNATKADYKDRQSLKNITKKDGDTVTLYAVWAQPDFTAKFDANGGTGGSSVTKKYDAELGTLPSASRSGYVFAGWYTTAAGGIPVTAKTTMPAHNVTYYAHWIEIRDFKYNGKVQLFMAPADGTYKLEAWGAGSKGTFSSILRGGYSTGTIYLQEGDMIYVSVGGSGTLGNAAGGTASRGQGGWNGGGNGGLPVAYNGTMTAGGEGGSGATSMQHFLSGDGQLKRYASAKETVYLVAGGSGGAVWNGESSRIAYNKGYGGGTSGGSTRAVNGAYTAAGGTQTSGYAFGQGQNAPDSANVKSGNGDEGNGGGGGGWYGGNAVQATGDNSNGGGAGGSGYVGSMLSDGRTVGGNSTITEPDGSSATGHYGDGYARITYISADKPAAAKAKKASRVTLFDTKGNE